MPYPAAPVMGEAIAMAGYLAVAYQDIRTRTVDDRTWIPVAAGIAVIAVSVPRAELIEMALKLALMSGLALAWRRMGLVAQADVPALALVAGSLDPLSPIPELAGALVVVAALAAAEAKFKFTRVMPIEEARAQGMWIPKRVIRPDGSAEDIKGSPEDAWRALEAYGGAGVGAGAGAGAGAGKLMVEATYGLPLAAALGIGYAAAGILALLL